MYIKEFDFWRWLQGQEAGRDPAVGRRPVKVPDLWTGTAGTPHTRQLQTASQDLSCNTGVDLVRLKSNILPSVVQRNGKKKPRHAVTQLFIT